MESVEAVLGATSSASQVQPKLPLVSAAGVRLGTEGLSPGSRSSLSAVF